MDPSGKDESPLTTAKISSTANPAPEATNVSTSYGAESVATVGVGGGEPSGTASVRAVAHAESLLASRGIVPRFRNVVATSNLCVALDLKEIAMQARNAEYNPKRYSALIMRLREPRTTALVFSSGKIVVTGAKSEAESAKASRKYAKIVYKLGYTSAKFTDFTIHNIVATIEAGFHIRPEALANAHWQFCSYEPELFSAIVYKMVQPKVCLLIFRTGKIIITGAKKRQDTFIAASKIYPVLQQHSQGQS